MLYPALMENAVTFATALNLFPGGTLVASAGNDVSLLVARITNAAADSRSTPWFRLAKPEYGSRRSLAGVARKPWACRQ